MTAGEFAFLALGLLLGLASGAALVVVIRARPPSREIRLTVASDAVPRRLSATLASDAFTTEPAEPARGGPADRRAVDRTEATDEPDPRLVPTPAWPTTPEAISARIGGTAAAPVDAVAILVHSEPDPELEELSRVPAAARTAAAIAADPARTDSAAATPTSATTRPDAILEPTTARSAPAAADAPAHGATSAAAVEPVASGPARAGPAALGPAALGPAAPGERGGPALPGPAAALASGDADPCSVAATRVDDQCRMADVARLGATTAARAAAEVRREYDEHRSRADHARAASEPRRIQHLKEEARTAFRTSRAAAVDRASADAAAVRWLTAVNGINATAREATLTVARSEAAANALLPTLERATAEADAARISAEAAEAGCRAAREELATCREAAGAAAAAREAAATALATRPTAVDPGPGSAVPVSREDDADMEDGAVAFEAPGAAGPAAPRGPIAIADVPTIIPLVDGDRATRTRVAATLDASGAPAGRPWTELLDGFVDAVNQRAIEETILAAPLDEPFWAPFSPSEARDILRALAALGFRFDGAGGWADGRIPSQRDLSLAVGYAGQDPMRIRQWPSEAEMSALLAGVRVGAAEYLVGAGGDLSLGEVVDLLGPHADALTDLWNAWGLVRPLLVAPAEVGSGDGR